ncbi:MAG: dihydroorotase [Gammaproteobacteria bacterium]|nr:dihydroorotase [Gammaproteobacteria bacterium]
MSNTQNTMIMAQPDDWHLHLRDGNLLNNVLSFTAKQFARAVIMPNLSPPITKVDLALAYRDRIIQALAPLSSFNPLMTLYLTEDMPLSEVHKAKEMGILAFKMYPAGATTNSHSGIKDWRKIRKILESMQKNGILLLIHGEVVDEKVDVFSREEVFIETQLGPLRHEFPELKMVLEHITTEQAVEYVKTEGEYLAATITAHHLLYNRNALFKGGLQPHYYCLPILKGETHRQALLQAATSGNPKFFLGTDSAPHTQNRKECAFGCAGCFTAYHALALYAEAFESMDALKQLEGFASFFGADYYGLPRNTQTIMLRKVAHKVPEYIEVENERLIPLRANEWVHWQVV